MQVNQSQTNIEVEKKVKGNQSETAVLSSEQINKKQLNAAILQSAIEHSNQSSSIKEQPLALVLKTALQGINDALKEIEPTQSLQQSYESEVDFSPEATAERIVTFSTNFFTSYQEQHPELGEQEARETFSDLMLEGVKKGVGEAKDILKALSVLEGSVETDIDKTMEYVLQGFEKFRNPESENTTNVDTLT
ncbi:DUF5610 domain-containing protein [Psychromonas sp.]|nr:DUF5610 domain-containing protein [Psychromonas sp.]